MTTTSLLRTALHDWHQSHGARLVDFAGWAMPVQYSSIVTEHVATRSAATLFDVSHMGRFRFDGPNAASFLDTLLTRRVADLEPGKIKYSLITNEHGGILDDVLAYHLVEPDGTHFMSMVVNAGNRDKIKAWIQHHLPSDVQFTDETEQTAMIAVQGPKATGIANRVLPNMNPGDLEYYSGSVTVVADQRAIVTRTGYTGEDGVEIIVPNDVALAVWESLLEGGPSEGGRGIIAAGLGARDTLRLEAAMPLYGHELNEGINPYQAGLGFAVNLKDRNFIGHAALTAARDDKTQLRQIGLELSGKRVPRQHYPITCDGSPIGEVTSGTFSPSLDRPIAMGFVQPDFAEIGRKLGIDVRGKTQPATVVKLPFYKRGSA